MNYSSSLLSNWESVFQQGLLTFWVFVSLHEKERSIAELLESISANTNNTYVTSEQSLYRLLRKQHDLELVDFTEVPSTSGGPNRKIYRLSPLGEELLTEFTKRNISPFHHKIVRSLLNSGDKNENHKAKA